MNMVRRLVLGLLAMSLLGGLLVLSSPAEEASAQAFGRNRVFHSLLSERKTIATATQYNGQGYNSFIRRGHRPPDNGRKIKSVYVPKGCTLITNNWTYETAWTKGTWSNIGKYPFAVVTLKMDCGFIKRVTT